MTHPVRIPADVDKEDQIIGPLTARQAALVAAIALLVFGGFLLSRPLLPPPAYLLLAGPPAMALGAAVLVHRDGLSGDRFLLAALRYRRSPTMLAPSAAPDGPALPTWLPEHLRNRECEQPAPLRLPAQGVDQGGVIDLGSGGHAALAACSTVNFSLRTGSEQQALTGAFARWLNALTGPAQVIVRAQRLDLAPAIDRLQQTAEELPHPALVEAARSHARFLTALDAQRNLLDRHVLLALREPLPAGPRKRTNHTGATTRLGHRISEAGRALAGCEVGLAPLDRDAATTVMTHACDPTATVDSSSSTTAGQQS